MFKKIAIIASTSVLFVAGQAYAGITPSGTIKVNVSGMVSQSVTLTCAQTFDATVSGNVITVHANGKNLGTGSNCNLVTFTNDWTVTATPNASGASFVVTGIKANTLTGNCNQTSANVVGGAWTNGSPGSGSITGSTDGTSFFLPKACNINLAITTNPNITVTNP